MNACFSEWVKIISTPPPALSKLIRLNWILGCVSTFVFLLKNPYRRNKKQPQKWVSYWRSRGVLRVKRQLRSFGDIFIFQSFGFGSISWEMGVYIEISDIWLQTQFETSIGSLLTGLFLRKKISWKSLHLLPLNVYSRRNDWDERDVMTVAHRVVDLKKTLNLSIKVWRLTCADINDALWMTLEEKRCYFLSEYIFGFGIGKQ